MAVRCYWFGHHHIHYIIIWLVLRAGAKNMNKISAPFTALTSFSIKTVLSQRCQSDARYSDPVVRIQLDRQWTFEELRAQTPRRHRMPPAPPGIHSQPFRCSDVGWPATLAMGGVFKESWWGEVPLIGSQWKVSG